MGRYDFRPSRVRQNAQMLLSLPQSRSSTPRKFPWYTAISDYPPSESVVRTQPIKHEFTAPQGTFSNPSTTPQAQASPPSSKSLGARRPRKPSKMFAPNRVAFEEDVLRADFFGDHPWELARPRQILEEDGRDYTRWDWSRAYEPGRPVSGESVVQRQLHLMRSPAQKEKHSKQSAYDLARSEHYAARHLAETETRIAREEALAVGAASVFSGPARVAFSGAPAKGKASSDRGHGFSKTANEIGMLLEKRTFDRWRSWAEGRVVGMEQTRTSAYTGDPGGAEGQPREESEGGLGGVIDGLGGKAGSGET